MVTGLGTGVALGALPLSAFSAWPTEAFDAETMDAAYNALYGVTSAEESSAITVKAPDIAENGAVVPISVTTDIPNADSVALLVAGNPSPLAVSFDLLQPGPAKVSTPNQDG